MRLIDADALLQKTISLARAFESNEDTLWYGKNKYVFKGVAYANHYISEAPTIDAVPVVRCKDCKHNENGNCYSDELWYGFWGDSIAVAFRPLPGFYCPYGERRTDE